MSLGEFLRAVILGPRSDAERRALQDDVDGSGGYAVSDMLSPEILDAVRAKAIVGLAGASFIPMESDNLRVAKITADPTPAWRAELGAVAESDPAFGATDLVARSLAVVTRVSREVIADAAGLEQAMVTALAGAFAAEIDGVALEGSGTPPEPKGLKTQSGLTAHDATTASTAYGGAWEEVLVGVRESFNVQILHERYADTGEIGLLCHARIDVGTDRAAKMGRIINLSAS